MVLTSKVHCFEQVDIDLAASQRRPTVEVTCTTGADTP